MTVLEGARIVVAEDEGLLLYILADTLALAGAEVVGTASDIDGAMALAECGGADVAVLDIDLRGRSSFPAARALRRRGVPVVFASGSAVDTMPLDLRSARFVRKPYGYLELVGAIRDTVAANRHRRPLRAAE